MADTENKLEALEQEAVAEASNPQADAPKKNAVAAEPNHLKNDAEDLGAAVVKPTDSNPDATKKVKQVSGDAQQKSQGAADPMPKLSGHNTKLEEVDSEETVEAKDESSEEIKEDEVKEEVVNEEETIDVSADVEALTADEGLSEEFKSKAATIFEAALKSKVSEMKKKMNASYEQKLKEESENAKSELVEKVDSYLSYVVEEWMKENALAVERGIKGEIAEDFIGGLKKLFEDHYIDGPDEKYNVLEDQASKIEELEKKLNESIEKNVELSKENGKHIRQSIIDEASKELADTAKEKFNKLAEEVEYSNEKDFTTKVSTIKESYFGKKVEAVVNEIDKVVPGNSQQPENL